MDTTFGDVKFSGLSKKLLADLRSNIITLPEFLKECAYWALKSGFNELVPKPLPTRPTTQAFHDYAMLPRERRLKVAQETFLKNPEINEYYAQIKQVESWNRQTLEWLRDILSYLPEGDHSSRGKVLNRIREFEAHQDAQTEVPPEAKAVLEVFGGRLAS